MENIENINKDNNRYGLQMSQIHFDDKELNQLATANVNVTSTETLDYTLDELEDLEGLYITYLDNSGWNRFIVDQRKL